MLNNIKVFDCTLREIGYQTGWYYDTEFVRNIYTFAQGKGIDYIELGFFHDEMADLDKGIYRYCSQKNDEVKAVFESIHGKTKISSMLDLQRPLSKLEHRQDSIINTIRIITRSHETDLKILEDKVNEIRKLGYEVFVNFTSAGYNSNEKNIEFAKFSKKIGLDVIYFADTESVFTKDFITHSFDICNAEDIKLGMHLHNKNGTANMLLEEALKKGCQYIDATLLGLGGKWHDGNITIEHILNKFNINGGYELNYLKTNLIQQLIKYNKYSTAELL